MNPDDRHLGTTKFLIGLVGTGNPVLTMGKKHGFSRFSQQIMEFLTEYHDGPGQFGVLRVMNDDLVQPKRGFGTRACAKHSGSGA